MSVLKQEYCPLCGKYTFHKYIPRLTLETSYWECCNCKELGRSHIQDNEPQLTKYSSPKKRY